MDPKDAEMREQLERAAALTQKQVGWDAGAAMAKLSEEHGEFAEQVLFALGHLKHKKNTSSLMEEGADVIIQVMDVIACVYKDEHPGTIADVLSTYVKQKLDKWEKVLADHYPG